MAARRGKVGDPSTRNALLDAAQELMLEEGYAAVTTRRVAAKAGLNSALVFYYFDTMDGLFIALFRRGAERSFERLEQALSSPQPLWGFWDLIHDRSGSAMTMEFIALANHRKAIRAEIAEYSRKFRRAQLDTLAEVLEGYGVDSTRWPPASVIVLMSGVSRFLLIEEDFDVDIGHAETIAMVEGHIRALEGDRGAAPAGSVGPGFRTATG
jgi:AcrR family transcriptional regulator